MSLAESFALVSKYGDEYMDETALVGEPGSFILSRSGDAAAPSIVKPSNNNNAPSRTATPGIGVRGVDGNSRKGGDNNTSTSEGDRLKRKKSK